MNITNGGVMFVVEVETLAKLTSEIVLVAPVELVFA